MILRTERLVLREIVPHDWLRVFEYQQDPRYLRFYDRDGVSEQDAQAFVARFIQWQGETPRARVQLAITLADTGELIGNVGIRRESAADPLADMGFELAPGHWGRGYASEAARTMVEWAFGDWGLERIHAHCIAENTGSARVLERAGLRLEACLRDHHWFKGRYWDVLIYGILRTEWEDG